jgi:hypothetical protein
MKHTDVRLIARRTHKSELGTLGQATLKGHTYDTLMVSTWTEHGVAVFTTVYENVVARLVTQHEGYTASLHFAAEIFADPTYWNWADLRVTYRDALAAPASAGFKKFATKVLEPLYPEWTFG